MCWSAEHHHVRVPAGAAGRIRGAVPGLPRRDPSGNQPPVPERGLPLRPHDDPAGPVPPRRPVPLQDDAQRHARAASVLSVVGRGRGTFFSTTIVVRCSDNVDPLKHPTLIANNLIRDCALFFLL